MKRILLSLFVGFVGIISFCSSAQVWKNDVVQIDGTLQVRAKNSGSVVLTVPSNHSVCFSRPGSTSLDNYLVCDFGGFFSFNVKNYASGFNCFTNNSDSSNTVRVFCQNSHSSTNINLYYYTTTSITGNLYNCSSSSYNFSVYKDGTNIVNSTVNNNFSLYLSGNLNLAVNQNGTGFYVDSDCPTCSECPSCPSCPTCQTCTGYNFSVFDNGSRIVNSPINTDINLYMQGSLFFTDLVSPDGDYVVESSCSTGNDCPVNTGYDCPAGNWSSLYINDIQHEGSSIIDITIPEEIAWDYSRSNDVFSVVVSGYNTDPAYIQSVIDVQNYQPTSDDFSKLVGLFGSYGGLLIACLFVIIVFYLIKKMFK